MFTSQRVNLQMEQTEKSFVQAPAKAVAKPAAAAKDDKEPLSEEGLQSY